MLRLGVKYLLLLRAMDATYTWVVAIPARWRKAVTVMIYPGDLGAGEPAPFRTAETTAQRAHALATNA